MLAQVLAVFLWNLLWLSRVKNRKAQILGISVGSLLFAWCHQMLVPAVISGVWIAVLICLGRWLNGWLMGGRKRMQDLTRKEWENIHWAETLALGLVTGSALWMVIVCVISLQAMEEFLLADSGPDPYCGNTGGMCGNPNQEKMRAESSRKEKRFRTERPSGRLCFRIPSTGSFMGVYPYHGSFAGRTAEYRAGL